MTYDADVIVVGAGLAGLCCAGRLAAGGVDFLILERSDDVGGRVRTDELDGFRLDRGFQILLTAYPEAREVLNYAALNLRPFYAGALVRFGGAYHRVADPWRHPVDSVRSLFGPIGGIQDKLRIARLQRHVLRGEPADLFASPDMPSQEFLRQFGFSGQIVDRFFRPFFGGVFLEPELKTSSRMLQFVFREFASGDVALPAEGMGALPRQLAGDLAPDRVRLQTEVASLEGESVILAGGERLRARAVVVATEGPAAAKLLKQVQPPGSHSATCLYFAAEKPPIDEPILVLNGEGQGPLNNLCVPSVVAPSYAPAGAALISASVLGPLSLPHEVLERQVQAQLGDWFGSQVDRWTPLRTYRIPQALPIIEPRWEPGTDRPFKLLPGVYVCGDHRANPSIQGAMASGRRAAEAVLADLR